MRESSSTCSVSVTQKKRHSAIATQTSVIGEAPKFVIPAVGQQVEEGANIVLEAMVSGVPEPKITWMFQGQPVKMGPHTQVQMAGSKTALYIMKVRKM